MSTEEALRGVEHHVEGHFSVCAFVVGDKRADRETVEDVRLARFEEVRTAGDERERENVWRERQRQRVEGKNSYR